MFLLRKKRRIVILLILAACIAIPLLVLAPWRGSQVVEYAKVVDIRCGWNVFTGGCTMDDCPLTVILKRTSYTQAECYFVDLWENGELRDESLVCWTEPELNVGAAKAVSFSLTQHEEEVYSKAYSDAVEEAYYAHGYLGKDIWEYPGFRSPLMDIFDVRVLLPE